jgi:hypothetical protein
MAGKRRRDRMLALSGTSTIRSSPHAWPSPGSLSNGSHAALFVTIDVQRLPAIRRPYSPNSVEPSANERFWHSSAKRSAPTVISRVGETGIELEERTIPKGRCGAILQSSSRVAVSVPFRLVPLKTVEGGLRGNEW